MSSRVDPHPPTSSELLTGDAPPSTAPLKEPVTSFVINPAAESHEERTNSKSDGNGTDGDGAAEDGAAETLSRIGGRSDGAYWGGGVALHYQRLEDEYV